MEKGRFIRNADHMNRIISIKDSIVNLKLYDDIVNITEDVFSEMLLSLPDWRKEKALSYRFLSDRVLCAESYLLLKEQLMECYGISEDIEFEYEKKGKPVLKGRSDVHFNLSHCKKAALSVMASVPVGCDIEVIPDELNMDICNYSFNEKELKEIVSSDNPCIEFARYWTMKEAFVKLTGEGITDDLRQLFSDDLLPQQGFETVTCPEKGYVYSVCIW